MKLKSKKIPISLFAGAALVASSFNGLASEPLSMTVKNQSASGKPSFVTGNMGIVTQGNAKQALQDILSLQSAYGANGNEAFKVKRQWTDSLGKMHTHFDQTINGLKVYGTSMILHADLTNTTLNAANNTGNVYAISGALAVDNATNEASLNSLVSQSASAQSAAQSLGQLSGEPELAYLYTRHGNTKLVWRTEVSWDHGPGNFGRDFVYFDAHSLEVVERHPQVHSAKSWRTYTLNGGSSNSAPGQLLCTNNQSCGGNASAQRAHDGASTVYDYYSQKHGRDSINGSGMALVSSVDLGEQNAYWTGSQMIYGQAGGSVDNDFTSDFDVIAHEFTHGVTQHSANLVYQYESGALNEAWSDIFGVTAEAFKDGKTTSTWLLGDGLYNTPGKAFRYMDNPTQDGQSYDYYPERYTGSQDNGGVHLNSGIANLAYVLLVDGGSHPRNKTTAQVPAIGMAKAEKIFYRALTTYMNQNTQFAGARTATATAANDLYGASEKTAVELAWCAVGVGNCPSTDPDPDPDPDPDNVLQNGVAKTGLNASTGSDLVYTMDVPSGATNIQFNISGGTGDADLYVKYGSAPTDSSYDCRPYKNGNSESCTGSNSGGKYYVRLKAYQSFSGVSLTGSYSGGTDPDPDPDPTDPIYDTVSNITVGQGQWAHYTQELPASYSSMTITISGGSGDVDLYVRHGAQSTSTLYDCRPYQWGNNETCSFNLPAGGTWYIDLYGYYYSSGVTLTLQANP